jgi:2-methylcitrate synthase
MPSPTTPQTKHPDASAPIIAKGLDGVIVDTTAISEVTSVGEHSSLVYRGYPAQDLAEKCSFEEVAYLLWYGELPNRDQLADFSSRGREVRAISPDLLEVLSRFPRSAHPMDMVRTAVSWLGMEARDTLSLATDLHRTQQASIELMAKAPTIVAACLRLRRGEEPIEPDLELMYSENFFNMCFGRVPEPEVVKAFDVSMVLYAEHSFNASTFTARVTASTLSDVYSAVVAAIGSLKGPLHGGANEMVMHMLQEIGEPGKAKKWVLDALAAKKKIMGFGHRVYKKQDSRAPTMDKYGRGLAKRLGDTKWHDIAAVVEKTMIEAKNIYPNLDFPTGPAYYLMGFDIDFFTPLFVMARISGWTAHIMEQMRGNRLIRPLAEYVGPPLRQVVPLDQR